MSATHFSPFASATSKCLKRSWQVEFLKMTYCVSWLLFTIPWLGFSVLLWLLLSLPLCTRQKTTVNAISFGKVNAQDLSVHMLRRAPALRVKKRCWRLCAPSDFHRPNLCLFLFRLFYEYDVKIKAKNKGKYDELNVPRHRAMIMMMKIRQLPWRRRSQNWISNEENLTFLRVLFCRLVPFSITQRSNIAEPWTMFEMKWFLSLASSAPISSVLLLTTSKSEFYLREKYSIYNVHSAFGWRLWRSKLVRSIWSFLSNTSRTLIIKFMTTKSKGENIFRNEKISLNEWNALHGN